MIRILKKHKKVGILSPCSKTWGERQLLKKEKTILNKKMLRLSNMAQKIAKAVVSSNNFLYSNKS